MKVLETRYRVDVEGHSDDRPFYRKDKEGVETNWSLSGKRASSVVHHLLDFGFSPMRIRVVGYASTRPMKEVKGKEGKALERARAENRRVSLLIR
ncbi:MAG: OmpA family protein, partial [Oligoflexales bacterium]|nr:OmpA family protein [Oligoflexales bacterium]